MINPLTWLSATKLADLRKPLPTPSHNLAFPNDEALHHLHRGKYISCSMSRIDLSIKQKSESRSLFSPLCVFLIILGLSASCLLCLQLVHLLDFFTGRKVEQRKKTLVQDSTNIASPGS